MPSETQACLDDIGVCLPSKGDLTNATSRKPVRIDLKDGSARRKPEDISWMLDRQWQYPYMDTSKVSRHPSSPIQGVSTCRPEEVVRSSQSYGADDGPGASVCPCWLLVWIIHDPWRPRSPRRHV